MFVFFHILIICFLVSPSMTAMSGDKGGVIYDPPPAWIRWLNISARLGLITVRVFQVPLTFYAGKQLPISTIQWSPQNRRQGRNFSQLWNPYTLNLIFLVRIEWSKLFWSICSVFKYFQMENVDFRKISYYFTPKK